MGNLGITIGAACVVVSSVVAGCSPYGSVPRHADRQIRSRQRPPEGLAFDTTRNGRNDSTGFMDGITSSASK